MEAEQILSSPTAGQEEVLYDRLKMKKATEKPRVVEEISHYDEDMGERIEVLYDRLMKSSVAEQTGAVEKNSETTNDRAERIEVLYDRLNKSSVAEQTGAVEKNPKDTNDRGNLNSQTDEGVSTLPFMFDVDLLRDIPTQSGQPYLKHMLVALQEKNIPPNLRNIIRECDFENEDTSSKLFDAVKNFKPHCNVMRSNKAAEIRNHLTSLISESLHKLRETNLPVFQGVTAVLLGSAEEGTRTFFPDEWDFVVFLPFLWETYKDRFPLTNKSTGFRLDNDTIAELEYELLGITNKQSYYSESKIIMNKLREYVTDVFKSVCKGVELRNACTEHKALALTVAFDTFDIKMDVSFGIRDESQAYKSEASSEFQKVLCASRHKEPFGTHETAESMLVRPLAEQPPLGFYIVYGYVVQATFTFEEVSYMQQLPENVRLCYQIAKCLIERCLPQYSLMCKCKNALFPSFWLKQLLFHLYQYYEHSRFWTEGQLPCRILELFVVYSVCLRYGVMNNGLPTIQSKYTKVGKYLYLMDEVDGGCMAIANDDLDQCIKNITALGDLNDVSEYFNAFIHERDDMLITFNGDVVSAFCMALSMLKQSQIQESGLEGSVPICTCTGTLARPRAVEMDVAIPLGQTSASTKPAKFQVLQCITMEGGVESLLVHPFHDGEMVIATVNPYLLDPWLVKYRCNEIIQDIALPTNTRDMCYINDRLVVIFDNKQITTYSYDEFVEISSFKTAKMCIGVTGLGDNSIVCLFSEGGVVKSTTSGDKLACSKKTFLLPLHIVTIRTQETIAVSDLSDHSVTGLSNDLQSVIFVYKKGESEFMAYSICWSDKKPDDKLYPRLICWNDVTNSIMVCQSSYGSHFELTDTGHFIRNFEIPYMLHVEKYENNSMCYDAQNQYLIMANSLNDRVIVYREDSDKSQ